MLLAVSIFVTRVNTYLTLLGDVFCIGVNPKFWKTWKLLVEFFTFLREIWL